MMMNNEVQKPDDATLILKRMLKAPQELAGSPGVGRAKLRLSRGFRVALACDVTPLKSGKTETG